MGRHCENELSELVGACAWHRKHPQEKAIAVVKVLVNDHYILRFYMAFRGYPSHRHLISFAPLMDFWPCLNFHITNDPAINIRIGSFPLPDVLGNQ